MRTKIVAKDKVLWNAAGRPSALGGEALNLVKLRFESGMDYKSEPAEKQSRPAYPLRSHYSSPSDEDCWAVLVLKLLVLPA